MDHHCKSHDPQETERRKINRGEEIKEIYNSGIAHDFRLLAVAYLIFKRCTIYRWI